MAAFIDNYDSAKNAYAQSDLQLAQARNQLGAMGNSVADLFYPKAQQNYADTLAWLAKAQSSADTGYQYTNLMKPQADTADRQLVVSTLDDKYFELTNNINEVRNSATTLGVEASNGEFKNRTVTSVEDLPDDSAGLVVRREQQAEADGASVQNPPAEFLESDNGNVITVPQAGDQSNADIPPLANNEDIGTNNGGAVSDVGGDRPTTKAVQSQAGVCAASDDWIAQMKSATGTSTSVGAGGRPSIPPGFTAPIIPTPNKLASLSSQTYSISIYMTTPKENNAIHQGQKVAFPPNSLIIQSGGINSTTVANQRNKYFDVDFYLDDLEIENIPGTQGSGAPHTVTTMKFRINEPNGITLLDRLDKAVREYAKLGDAPLNAISQNYCMIIRFYGYDQDGKLVTGEQLGLTSLFYGTDKNAISEKWIPFSIADMKYQVSSKGVEYDVTCAVTQTNTMFSSNFGGAIPFNVELVAPDLKTLFNGPVAYSTDQQTQANTTTTPTGASPAAAAASQAPGTNQAATPNTTTTAPQKASAASTKTITQGLAAALNQWQQDLVKKGTQELADQYEIQLYNMPGLIDATLIKQGAQDKTNSPMQLSSDASQQLLSSKNSYDKNSKTFNITAGTQIVQLIDQAMRNSSFITSQQTIAYDPVTQQPKRQQPVATTMWFRVQGSAMPIGYDRKRRNSAYKFKYIITPYQINDPRSVYYSPAKYRGTHKVYNYWFTGQNTEVLDFNIDVNFNYVMVVGNDVAVDAAFSGRWAEKRSFQTRPNESSQGGSGTATMPAASLAERLYSQSDVAKADVTIMGDPDWIAQSEIFYLNPTFNAFMPDGSVNTAGSEVLFEMRFNTPADFDLRTGVTNVFQNNTVYSLSTGESNLPSKSIVYTANIVKSFFKAGKFTQKLIGTIRNFPDGASATSAAKTSNNAAANQATQSRTPATQGPTTQAANVNNIQPFDVTTYNEVANTIDDAGGAEAVSQLQQQALAAASQSSEVSSIVESGGTVGTAASDTGTVAVQQNNPIQEDSNNDVVSPSQPTPTVSGMAPPDDAGYDP